MLHPDKRVERNDAYDDCAQQGNPSYGEAGERGLHGQRIVGNQRDLMPQSL
jgi:hypothetical protein